MLDSRYHVYQCPDTLKYMLIWIILKVLPHYIQTLQFSVMNICYGMVWYGMVWYGMFEILVSFLNSVCD